jgi:hypothetical protein
LSASLLRTPIVLSLMLAAMAITSDALAYRPFDGTDADVAELGHFELELGPVHWYSQRDTHDLVAPDTVLNLGFLPRWELVVDAQNFVALDAPRGAPGDQLLDTDVLTKVLLLPGALQDKGPWPSVAVELGPLLPNVNGEEAFGASTDVIVSERWPGFAMHVNDWFELTRGALHLDWFEGVILEAPSLARVRPVGELFVEHEFVASVTTWSALAGAIWRAGEGLDLDMGLREARVGGERATEVRIGLTWAVSVWRPAAGWP